VDYPKRRRCAPPKDGKILDDLLAEDHTLEEIAARGFQKVIEERCSRRVAQKVVALAKGALIQK
jgi:hypothetical protein